MVSCFKNINDNKVYLFSWCNKLPWKQKAFLFWLSDPIFFTAQKWSACQNKLSAKFHFKKILQSGFRATLNFHFCFILACWLHFRNIKWGLPSLFLRYEQLKLKFGKFLQGFLVAMITFYFMKTTEAFSAIIGIWYGTKTLLLNNKVLCC